MLQNYCFVSVYIIQNTNACSVVHLLRQFCWLLVEWRIKFKIATLTFKDLETGLPLYLAKHSCPYAPTELYALQHPNCFKFCVPTSSLAHALFVYLFPLSTLWNLLHHSVRFCESLATFWKHLKTFCFQAAFSDAPSDPPQRLSFSS